MFSRKVWLLLAVCILSLTTTAYAQNPSVCAVTIHHPLQIQTGGLNVTAMGTIKALFIFIDFPDDSFDPNNATWPVGTGPNFLNNIVDAPGSQPSGTYANVSTFFNDQSWGQFKMTGKAYYVQAPHPLTYYQNTDAGSEASYSAQDAIQLLDQRGVDFSQFDNWTDAQYSHTAGPDGVVDMVFLCYRIWYINRGNYGSSFIAEGWYGASLPGDVYVNSGARRVVSSHAIDVCNMIQYPRFEHLIHEFGHAWGLDHQYAPGMWSLMGQKQPTTSSFMNSLERVQLGWTTFTSPVSGIPYGIPDFGSTRVAYQIAVPNTNPQEYYIVENHQCSTMYDTPDLTGSKGIYILQNAQNVETGTEATLRVVPADGRWTWSVPYWIPNPFVQNPPPGEIIPVFQRGAVNRIAGLSDHDLIYETHPPPSNHDGYNMMFAWLDEVTGAELHGTRFKGDGRDRWNTTDNNVFSPWSNPGTSTVGGVQANFALRVTAENLTTGVDSIVFFVSNPAAVPPSKPQAVTTSWNSSGQILLNWAPNQEPNMLSGGAYDVYKAVYYSGSPLNYSKLNSSPVTTTSFVDNSAPPSGLPNGVDLYYRYNTKAIDNGGQVSVASDDYWFYMGKTPCLLSMAIQGYSASASATSGNNQRKLCRESSGNLHEVFESGSEVFYRRWNASTSAWDITCRLSMGTEGCGAPCITMAGSTILAAWQRLSGGSYFIELNRSTNGGTAWSGVTALGSYTCASPGPLPTISALGNSAFVSFRTSSSMMSWEKSVDAGASWNATSSVPGTTAGCNSPSSTVSTTGWSTPQANLVYVNDASHIYYNYYDFTTGWTTPYDLSAIIPSQYSNHLNPCLATYFSAVGGGFQTVWDAALNYPATRVIVHRKSSFRSPGSVYSIFQYNGGWNKPSISCVADTRFWMVCQTPSDGTIWKRYYNGTSWDQAATAVTTGSWDPQLSIGNSASAKYLYTTGSQSPYQIVLGSETLSKISGNVQYSRALNVIDTLSGAFVTMELGVPQIAAKDGSRIPVNFTTSFSDSLQFDLKMLLNAGMTDDFALPSNTIQIIVPVSIYAKNPGIIFDNNGGSIGLNVGDSRDGSTLASIAKTKSADITSGTNQVTELQIPIGASLLGKVSMRLVPAIAGIRGDRPLVFSLGHIYRTIGTDSLAKESPLTKEQILPPEYGLLQNYPNPFNPSTEFHFSLPEASTVSLIVYDVLGREVATIVNGNVQSGYHTTTWNASSVASGVYFARLIVIDEFGKVKLNQVNKLLLMK